MGDLLAFWNRHLGGKADMNRTGLSFRVHTAHTQGEAQINKTGVLSSARARRGNQCKDASAADPLSRLLTKLHVQCSTFSIVYFHVFPQSTRIRGGIIALDAFA